MSGARNKIGFYVYKDIHIPHHLREYYVSRELLKAGWEVEWFLPFGGKTSEDLQLDWPVIRYSECDFKGHKFVFPINFCLALKKRGIDHLWISGWAQRDSNVLRWFVTILKAFKINIIYDTVDPIDLFNDAHSSDEEHKAAVRKNMRTVYGKCDLVLAVTPQIKELIEHNGGPPERVFSCRWGTDLSVFTPDGVTRNFRERIGIPEDCFLVGWLGSMNPFKGLKEIIMPLVEASYWKQIKVHFVLAGYGLLEEELKSWAQERPHLPVTILGRIPYKEAADFTWSLDAYLVPTNPESGFARSICPVKCFDGLAMGVDVLVTRTEGTAFLEGLARNIHLCDFSYESFLEMLEVLIAAGKGERERNRFCAISHQVVSREICRLILDRVGVSTAGRPYRVSFGAGEE